MHQRRSNAERKRCPADGYPAKRWFSLRQSRRWRGCARKPVIRTSVEWRNRGVAGFLFHGGPRTESWVQCLFDEPSAPSPSPLTTDSLAAILANNPPLSPPPDRSRSIDESTLYRSNAVHRRFFDRSPWPRRRTTCDTKIRDRTFLRDGSSAFYTSCIRIHRWNYVE